MGTKLKVRKQDALEQSKFIAAINIQRQPLYLEWYPCLENMNLPDVSGKSKNLDLRTQQADALLDDMHIHDSNVSLDIE